MREWTRGGEKQGEGEREELSKWLCPTPRIVDLTVYW